MTSVVMLKAFCVIFLAQELWAMDFLENADFWPTEVPKFEIRQHANKAVQSGLVHTLPEKTTLAEFRQHLQCVDPEVNLGWNSGITNILQMVPPTAETLKLMCAYMERPCNWNECRTHAKDYEAGNYKKHEDFSKLSDYSRPRLFRVMKGEMYYDWPWGMDRYTFKEEEHLMVPLFKMTLDLISDMGDSAFFIGGEQAGLGYDKPVPMFAFSTSETYADMPFPWWEMWQSASRVYKLFRKNNLHFTEENYKKETLNYKEWKNRIPKAAFFSTLTRSKQFLFDAARLYPDLFDARFAHSECIPPWNPASSENCTALHNKSPAEIEAAQSLPGGYLLPLLKLQGDIHEAEHHLASYKYIVVPLGNGMTSDRLAQILTFSGAVVLMQRSAYKYHFSAQFLPWVHYVPTSYSGADVFEKVQWLKLHDDFAQQIAENGRNFARSFLRLEDYYCYTAHALETMAEIGAMTDVTTKPYTPKKLLPFKEVKNETEAYVWPK